MTGNILLISYTPQNTVERNYLSYFRYLLMSPKYSLFLTSNIQTLFRQRVGAEISFLFGMMTLYVLYNVVRRIYNSDLLGQQRWLRKACNVHKLRHALTRMDCACVSYLDSEWGMSGIWKQTEAHADLNRDQNKVVIKSIPVGCFGLLEAMQCF